MSGTVTDYFNYYFHEVADKRVESWFLMKDPIGITILSACYLYFILRCGPRYMKDRPAYDLRPVLQVYNVIQVIVCVYLLNGLWQNGWRDKFTPFKCYNVDYVPLEGESMNLLQLCYYTTLLKLVEFSETIFFVLRKKYNQVSYLHLYHHVSTVYFMWCVAKYAGGGMATYYIVLNSIVHVVMYTYYFFATLGPQWQAKLAPLKPKITAMQMVQFVLMVLHAPLAFTEGCNMPKFITLFFIVNIFINFFMFYNFFKVNYIQKKGAIKKRVQ